MLRRAVTAAALLTFSATSFSATPLALPALPLLGGSGDALQLPLIGSLTDLGLLGGLGDLGSLPDLGLLEGLGDLGSLSSGSLLPPLPMTPTPVVRLVASLTMVNLEGLPVTETVVILNGLLTPIVKPINDVIPLPVVGPIFSGTGS